MITAEEAKKIAENQNLKEENEAKVNTDHYLPILNEIIEDTASKGNYTRNIHLGSQIGKDIYIVNFDDQISSPILMSYLIQCLEDKGFKAKLFSYTPGYSPYGEAYLTVSWK